MMGSGGVEGWVWCGVDRRGAGRRGVGRRGVGRRGVGRRGVGLGWVHWEQVHVFV